MNIKNWNTVSSIIFIWLKRPLLLSVEVLRIDLWIDQDTNKL